MNKFGLEAEMTHQESPSTGEFTFKSKRKHFHTKSSNEILHPHLDFNSECKF